MVQLSPEDMGSKVLQRVREGMAVYDVDGQRVGVVDYVFLGAASEQTLERGEGPATAPDPSDRPNSLVDDLVTVFAPDNLPEELKERLRRNGFLRIDADGLFAPDRYVMPDQVARVDEHVHLSVQRAALIKR